MNNLYMTIHNLAPGQFSSERIQEIARLGQTDPVVRGYRSFHSLTEGRIVWLLQAPSREAVQAWCQSVGLPLDGITELELEGFVGNIRAPRTTIPNQVRATVENVVGDALLTIVTTRLVSGERITALVDSDEGDIAAGSEILLLFRATNLSLVKSDEDTPLRLSFPNQIRGRVTNIIAGPTLVIVHIDTPAGPIVSAIIPSAAEQIDLKVGDDVTALFKALDVSIGKL